MTMATELWDVARRAPHCRLLVLGDAMLDRYTWGAAERVSPEAPVLVLRDEESEVRLGGAASVAQLVRGLDAQVSLLSVVGDDAEGRIVRRLLKEAGIDQATVVTDPERPTTSKQRFLGRAAARHPQQLLRVDRETTAPVTDDVVRCWQSQFEPWLANTDAVLIADYGKGVCRPDLLRTVIDAASSHDIPVLVDPTRVADYGRYRGATLLKPNRLEAGLAVRGTIASPTDALRAGKELRDRHACKSAVITLDHEGMAWSSADGEAHVPARVRDVYDITGAGDTVLALLGLGHAAGWPLATSVHWANVAAGAQVGRWGVTPITWRDLACELAEDRGRSGTVLDLAELETRVRDLRARGRSIVLTNGCFDLLHVGHVTYLQEAARLGDLLIVAVNGDDSVRRLKGPGRPMIGQNERAAMLAALACVDYVVVFDEDTPHRVLKTLRPDVLVKGGTYTVDQVVGREVVEAYGGRVAVTGRTQGFSTSSLVNRIRGATCE